MKMPSARSSRCCRTKLTATHCGTSSKFTAEAPQVGVDKICGNLWIWLVVAEDEPTGYPPDALDAWTQRLRERSAQYPCDVFVYFISGAKVRAPAAARALLQRLVAPV